jgi:hypothetical protein
VGPVRAPLPGESASSQSPLLEWQLLYLDEALEMGSANVPIDWILDPASERSTDGRLREFYSHVAKARATLDANWRNDLLLLVRIQSRYYPAIRGTITKLTASQQFDFDSGDFLDSFSKTMRTFEPPSVLSDLGMTPAEIAGAHRRIALRGITRDPNSRFYDLFRMAPYSVRDKLAGVPRRSQDAYDAAEMIRRLYHDLTGELLPTAEQYVDASDGQWRTRLYGPGPTLRYSRSDLQTALRVHHLDPHIVHIIVEGESDRIIVGGLLTELSGFGLDALGVTISTLEGGGNTRLHAKLLRLAKNSARFPVLIADREGDIERDVQLLKEQGLLDDDTAILWETSLEEDNFTDAELIEAARRLGDRKGATLRMDPLELRAAHAAGSDHGLAETLLRLARQPDHGAVRFSKPELAADLLDLLLTTYRAEDGLAEPATRRPILEIVASIIRVT